MSQSGPYPGPSPQPGRDPGEPYTEPADPWSGHATWPVTPAPGSPGPGFEPSYGFDRSRSGTGWTPPAPPRRRGPGTAIVVLVAVLGVLVVVGGGVAWWLIARGGDREPVAQPQPAPSSAAPSIAPSDETDARFVTAGQCVRNEGSEDVPQMTIAPCAEGTFEVLKRVDGATTGEPDAEKKCATVSGYTNWYFYDSELDGLDFVLCLRGR